VIERRDAENVAGLMHEPVYVKARAERQRCNSFRLMAF
jgi:hypothetical protein